MESASTSSDKEEKEDAMPTPTIPSTPPSNSRNNVVVKVGMVGDAQVGKTSLMVKYVEGKFDEDYIHTLVVNFMEKTINSKNIGLLAGLIL